MNKYKISLRRLFSNTKFLIVFSIIVAFIFWIVVAIEYAPIIETTISNVPVKIDMEDSVPERLGLQIFGQKDFNVDISVEGSRFAVGSNLLNADSFTVTAQTAYVNSSGKHSLMLNVVTNTTNTDFKITNISTDHIEVFFDKYAEKEMEITPNITTKNNTFTDEDYSFVPDDVIFPTKTVTLAGAQSELSKINKVYADINIQNKLKECVTVDANLKFDVDADTVPHISFKDIENGTIPVTLPVYKILHLPTAISFKNSPPDFVKTPLDYTISPASVNVAVLQNGSLSNEKIEVGTVDFSSIDASGVTLTFDASKIENVKILDDISEFTVKINASDFTSTTFELDKSRVSVETNDNSKNRISVDLSPISSVKAIGKSDSLNKLTSADVYGKIVLEDTKLEPNQATRVPVEVYIKDSADCWVYDYYYAYVTLNNN